MENRRPCRKCLLAELDDKTELARVRTAIDRLDAADKVTGREYEERLIVCRECDYLNEGTCNACGCYVELRAAAKSGKCPYDRWSRQINRRNR